MRRAAVRLLAPLVADCPGEDSRFGPGDSVDVIVIYGSGPEITRDPRAMDLPISVDDRPHGEGSP